MLHVIVPSQVSGPNRAVKLISESFLSDKYEFGFLTQQNQAGGFLNLSVILDLKRQIKSFKPDIIHLSGLQSAAFHAVIAARLANQKNILIAIRGTTRDAENISRFRSFVFSDVVEPLTLKLSNSFYTVCNAMAQRVFLRKYSKKFRGTIHNSAPVLANSFQPAVNLRKDLLLEAKQILIAIVGRIIYDKGVTYITEAIKKLQRNDITFVFIGEGREQAELEKTLENEIKLKQVAFVGQQKDVISILKQCEIFLFATLHENLSNALLEAASLELAIIATNVGGNPEVIHNNINGLLIPPKDSGEIVKAVHYLADNSAIRLKLGKAARRTTETSFSQDKLLAELDSVYSKMLIKN